MGPYIFPSLFPKKIFNYLSYHFLGLSRMNGGEETFLLVTAALANLTFMSPLSSAAMKRCGKYIFLNQISKQTSINLIENLIKYIF